MFQSLAIYHSTISFPYFELFFTNISILKKNSPTGMLQLPPSWRVFLPHIYKNICILTVTVINKWINFKNDCLKIIRIENKSLNFVLYHHIKEIDNFGQQWNLYSDMHQNLISTSSYQNAAKFKFHATFVYQVLSSTCFRPQNLCYTWIDRQIFCKNNEIVIKISQIM